MTNSTPDPRNHIADHGPWKEDSDLDAALRLSGDFAMDDAEQARVHRRPEVDGPSDSDVARMWMNSYNEYVADNARLYKLIDKFQELTQEQYNKYQEELATLRAELAAANTRLATLESGADDLCICGHPQKAHDFYVDHDECRECDGDEPCSEFVATVAALSRAEAAESALSAVTDSRDRMRAALEDLSKDYRNRLVMADLMDDKEIDIQFTLFGVTAALAEDAPGNGAGDEVAG